MAKEYEQLVISDDSEMHNRGTEDTKANLPLYDECVKIFFNTKGKKQGAADRETGQSVALCGERRDTR